MAEPIDRFWSSHPLELYVYISVDLKKKSCVVFSKKFVVKTPNCVLEKVDQSIVLMTSSRLSPSIIVVMFILWLLRVEVLWRQ